jgi:hypothetical protein
MANLSESQIRQLQEAFNNQPADVIRGQLMESSDIVLEAATKKKGGKKKAAKKPKPKAKPRPKAKSKSQVV